MPKQIIQELEKLLEVLKDGIKDLDTRKDYEDAKSFIVGIKIAVDTLIEKQKRGG